MSPVPTYGGRMIGDRDQYARLDVHLDTGAQDYDVMGYRESQVIHDCLDQYEQHLEFLRLGELPARKGRARGPAGVSGHLRGFSRTPQASRVTCGADTNYARRVQATKPVPLKC